MSTSTGKITGQWDFPTAPKGSPYVLFPGNVPGNVQGAAFFQNLNNEKVLYWSQFDIPTNSATNIGITKGDDVTADMFSVSSQPLVYCGNTAYSFYKSETLVDDFYDVPKIGGISAFDITNGDLLWKTALPQLENKDWGALACA